MAGSCFSNIAHNPINWRRASVNLCIGSSDSDGNRIGVASHHLSGPKLGGCNSQNPRSRTHIEDASLGPEVFFDSFQAELCGFVSSRSESHTRLNPKWDATIGGGAGLVSTREEVKSFSDRKGTQLAPPPLKPVLFFLDS